MASGMGVDIKLFHTGRKTTMGERVADALSKENMEEVRAEMPDDIDVSSRVLGKWLDDPVVTRSLARRGLMEVAMYLYLLWMNRTRKLK